MPLLHAYLLPCCPGDWGACGPCSLLLYVWVALRARVGPGPLAGGFPFVVVAVIVHRALHADWVPLPLVVFCISPRLSGVSFFGAYLFQESTRTITKKIGGDKNGGERVITKSVGPKWYNADDVKTPLPSRKHNHKPRKLRASLKPGAIVILLSGRHRGKRVVMLGSLPSGLILVTGPYTINGVPMRRVDPAYVIGTSTIVDVSGVDVSKYNDAYFKRTKKPASSDADMEDSEAKKMMVPEHKVADQKIVDASLVAAIKKDRLLKGYLSSKFSLTNGQFPHELKF